MDIKQSLPLSDEIMKDIAVAKTFKEYDGRINSIHFSWDGQNLITSSEDDQIVIYDCEQGTQKRLVNSQKYGVDLVRFTHSKTAAIHASTKRDDAIRYLSLHDNKFIRYFTGHTKRVISLEMSPADDLFLSGGLDNSVRLWDLKNPTSLGVMQIQGKPVCAFDPEGIIFCVGVQSEQLKLYDLRSFEKGPFVTFKLPQEKQCEWTGLKFSPDGKHILLTTNGSVMRLIDAFNGNPTQSFAGHLNNKGIPIEGCFSPDSQFVISGSTDGRVHIWNTETGYKVCVLCGGHPSAVQCVQFNPSYMLMATGCSHLNLWIPKTEY